MFYLTNVDEVIKGQKLIIPVLSDHKMHWSENRLSFVYLYNLETFEEQILGVNHNDVSKCEILRLSNFLTDVDYCYKAKYLSPYNVNLSEAELVVWFQTNQKSQVQEPKILRDYWNQFDNYRNTNDCIPIMKWLEYCRDVKDEFLIHFKDFQVTEGFLKYNQFLRDLAEIEKNGLFTN